MKLTIQKVVLCMLVLTTVDPASITPVKNTSSFFSNEITSTDNIGSYATVSNMKQSTVELSVLNEFLSLPSGLDPYTSGDEDLVPDPETQLLHGFGSISYDATFDWSDVTPVIIDQGFGSHQYFEDLELNYAKLLHIDASQPESRQIKEVYTLDELWDLSYADYANHDQTIIVGNMQGWL